MRFIIRLLTWIIIALLAYKVALWAFEEFQSRQQFTKQSTQKKEVLDTDKVCKVIADTGQCVCRHRKTNDRLALPYDECVSRAR